MKIIYDIGMGTDHDPARRRAITRAYVLHCRSQLPGMILRVVAAGVLAAALLYPIMRITAGLPPTAPVKFIWDLRCEPDSAYAVCNSKDGITIGPVVVFPPSLPAECQNWRPTDGFNDVYWRCEREAQKSRGVKVPDAVPESYVVNPIVDETPLPEFTFCEGSHPSRCRPMTVDKSGNWVPKERPYMGGPGVCAIPCASGRGMCGIAC